MLRDDSNDIDAFSGAHVIRSESAIDLTNAVSDFYKFGRPGAFEVIRNRGDPNLPEKIILHTRRRNYPIAVANFITHSKKIKELHAKHDLPRIVNLTSYNVDSVRAFVDYMCNVEERHLRLTRTILTDLLQLARIFHVQGLIDVVVRYLFRSLDMSHTGHLTTEAEPKAIGATLMLNLLLATTDWSLACDERLRRTLIALAADAFPQIRKLPKFRKLPLSVLVVLLNRCDVEVLDEADVADAALTWLDAAPRTEAQVRSLARTVRSAYLSQAQIDGIMAKAKNFSLSEKNLFVFLETLHTARNQRVCLIASHMKDGYKRCGMPKEHGDKLMEGLTPIDLAVRKKPERAESLSMSESSPLSRSSSELTAISSSSSGTMPASDSDDILLASKGRKAGSVKQRRGSSANRARSPPKLPPTRSISEHFPHIPAPPK
uniref:BACK domain-containing protein n=1 Tax=Panagrellus redivivus TaxID=6233 RepID=A0A7E4ZYY8_PANRE